MDDSIECENRENGEGDSNSESRVFGEDGGAEGGGELENSKNDGIVIRESITVFVVELVEDGGKDCLEHADKDGISGEETVGGWIHAHEFNVEIEIKEDDTMDDERCDAAQDDAGHDNVFVFATGAIDVGASRKGATDDVVEKLDRIGERENVDEVGANNDAKAKPE